MSKRREGGIGGLLSVVALVAIGVFMWWLSQESRQIDVQRAEAAAAELEAERDLNAGDLLARPGVAVGRSVIIDSIRVAMSLGQGVLAISLSETTAFPVLLSSDAIQRLRMVGITLYGGDVVFLRGRVYTLTDSIRGEWVTQGAVDAAMQESIPSGPAFLLADSIHVY